MLLMLEQVLDLDGHVVGDGRKFSMKYLHEVHRMTNAIKKIRVAEGNVLRPCNHLAPNVF